MEYSVQLRFIWNRNTERERLLQMDQTPSGTPGRQVAQSLKTSPSISAPIFPDSGTAAGKLVVFPWKKSIAMTTWFPVLRQTDGRRI